MTARPHRRDGEATRERLLRAALELFTSAGFLETTTAALAERAGVAEGTIYRHFPSKDALFNEAYRRSLRLSLDALAAPEADRTTGAPERLAAFSRRLVQVAAEDGPSARMILGTAQDAFLDEASRTLRRQFDAALVQLVAMGKSDGQVRAGPAEVWAQVWLTVVGYAAGRVGAGEWTAESGNVALTLEAAWTAIAAPATASLRPVSGASEDRQAPDLS